MKEVDQLSKTSIEELWLADLNKFESIYSSSLDKDYDHSSGFVNRDEPESKTNPRQNAKQDAMKLLQTMDQQKAKSVEKAGKVREETKNDTLKLLDKLNG